MISDFSDDSLAPAKAALPKISRYNNLQLVGQGGSGAVYSARSEATGNLVAIKIFKRDLTPDAGSVRRFKQEVETLSKLSSPHIVKILDYGTTGKRQSYIVMELADGLSLRTALDTEGVFTPRRAATIAREICQALEAAHEQEIIHRDLKPNNIILGKDDQVKLIDFGVAKAVGFSTDTITQYGAIVGTPEYMSPEQCLGQTVDARSDIYSLGCTLFEMLTKTKAFESNNAVEAIAKQISPDRSHLSRLLNSAGAPGALCSIVEKCIEREPANRYRTVSEVDHDLSAFLLNVPLAFATRNKLLGRFTTASSQLAARLARALGSWTYTPAKQVSERRSIIRKESIDVFGVNISSSVSYTGPGIAIRDRFTGQVIFAASNAITTAEALIEAAQKRICLHGANLCGADLTHLKLSDLDLTAADLTGAQLIQAKFTNVDLSRAILEHADLTQATLIGVRLKEAQMRSATLIQCKAPLLLLDGADLTGAMLNQTYLERASCRGTNFHNANCTYANFNGAITAGIKAKHAQGMY
jgi:serine/threonine protein kinase